MIYDNGTPATYTQVRVLPGNYNPVNTVQLSDLMSDTTDSSGAFRITVCNGGVYNVEAFQPGSGNRALVTGIAVELNETVSIQTHAVQKPGTIQIFTSDGNDFETGYVYIPGSTRFAEIINGSAIIDSVPAGYVPEIWYSDNPELVNDRLIVTSVNVISGEAAVVLNTSNLNYWKRFYLNTTSAGADMSGMVMDFPVLIRLTTANFDFSKVDKNGAGLRFIKENGKHLPYEIEKWDAGANQSEVWVKIDTIYGNDSSHSFIMYTVDSSSENRSDGTIVFDTSEGFQAVWHMNQPGNSNAIDATINNFKAFPSGFNNTSRMKGMIGDAQRFDGASSYFTVQGSASGKLSFPQDGNYTLSTWVYTEVVDSQAHYIISKSNKNYNLDLSAYNLWEFYDIKNGVGCESNFTPPHLQQWKYLTGVRNGSDQRIYIDGICVDSSILVTTGITVRDSTFDVQIGKRAESDYGYWNGIIDEVIISNRSRSADWIRLCFMNQRKDDKLIEFK
jgi:hypothetical protein